MIGSYAIRGDDLVIAFADGSQILAKVRDLDPTIISGNLVKGQGEEEMLLPVLLSLTTARVLPMFPEMA